MNLVISKFTGPAPNFELSEIWLKGSKGLINRQICQVSSTKVDAKFCRLFTIFWSSFLHIVYMFFIAIYRTIWMDLYIRDLTATSRYPKFRHIKILDKWNKLNLKALSLKPDFRKISNKPSLTYRYSTVPFYTQKTVAKLLYNGNYSCCNNSWWKFSSWNIHIHGKILAFIDCSLSPKLSVRRGLDRMVARFTTNAISAYRHCSCEYKSHSVEVYSMQHYVIVCQWPATDQRFSPGTLVSSTNKTDRHDITEI